MKLTVLAILGTSLLSGCVTTGTVVVSDLCQSYSVIRPSRSDTPDTLRQIAAANAKYRAVCQAQK